LLVLVAILVGSGSGHAADIATDVQAKPGGYSNNYRESLTQRASDPEVDRRDDLS